MRNIVKLTVRLMAVAAVAGLLLGVTYAVTKNPIAVQQKKESEMAKKTVLPDADTFENVDLNGLNIGGYENIREIAKGYRGGELVGATVSLDAKGFNPGIKLTVGIGTDGTLKGIQISEHQETPGLGAKAAEPAFTGEFAGVAYNPPLVTVKYPPEAGNEIQAISGATITSDGIVDAANTAAAFYQTYIEGGESWATND